MDESAPAIANIRSKSIFDYIFFLRPMLHPPVWTIVILGYCYSLKFPAPISRLFLLLIVSSAAAGWAYIINQISDIESDRINNKVYFLPQGIISVKSAYILAALSFAITVIGGFLIGKLLGILFIIGLELGYFYSGKPFYWKNHPLGSSLSNGVAHGVLPFLAGYISAGGMPQAGLIYSLPYFFAVTAVFIGTTIPDIPGDLPSSKITPGVVLGIRPAVIIMTLCLLASLDLAFVLRDIFLLAVACLCLPFYIAAVIKPVETRILLAIKISILLLSLAACIRFWPYAIILAALFVGTRLYYKRRFGMVYPSL